MLTSRMNTATPRHDVCLLVVVRLFGAMRWPTQKTLGAAGPSCCVCQRFSLGMRCLASGGGDNTGLRLRALCVTLCIDAGMRSCNVPGRSSRCGNYVGVVVAWCWSVLAAWLFTLDCSFASCYLWVNVLFLCLVASLCHCTQPQLILVHFFRAASLQTQAVSPRYNSRQLLNCYNPTASAGPTAPSRRTCSQQRRDRDNQLQAFYP
jgi:hypothetical protein